VRIALDPPHRRRLRSRLRPHRPAHPVLSAVRVLVSCALAALFAGVAIMLLPYRTTVAGVDVVVTGTVQPSKRGVSVTSSLGTLRFGDVVALPVGLHAAPEIDLAAVRAATGAGASFASRARVDLQARAPRLLLHFALAAVAGLLVGALAGGLLVDGAVALLGGDPDRWLTASRRHALGMTALRVASVTVGGVLLTALVAGTTYRSGWTRQYTVSGLLADVAATPDRLTALDERDSAAAGRIRAVLRLQDALTRPAPQDAAAAPERAYSVLLVSDVHRRNIYPYLEQYVQDEGVALIVNTGDETLVGNRAELTDAYLASIAEITRKTPMIWIKGNHDSPRVAARMASVPGVTVLDGQVVTADGLQVYGVGDPRTYGAAGDAGSDAPDVVTRIETQAAQEALAGLDRSTYLDLLLAHEPVQAEAMSLALGSAVRAQASGHVHRQNPEGDLQRDGHIRLVEGTTGLGGLLADPGDPMSFSILSVAPDCQFTRIVRYQLADPARPAETETTSFGGNSSYVVHYFARQPTVPTRTCAAGAGVSAPVPASAAAGLATVADWGVQGQGAPAEVAATPTPVTDEDEAPDRRVRPPTSRARSRR